MSDISGITGAGVTTGLIDFLVAEEEESSSIFDGSTTNASAARLLETGASAKSKSRASSAYGTGAASGIGQAAVKRAISEMQGKVEGPITFAKIAEYREDLEESFSVQVRAALAKAGVDPATEFTLTLSADGKVQVECDDPIAKEKIQGFLTENKEVCEQFGYIQALANLERAKQSPAGVSSAWSELRNSKAAIQAQAVEMFFSDAVSSGMNYSSLLADFSGSEDSSSTSFYSGVDYTV